MIKQTFLKKDKQSIILLFRKLLYYGITFGLTCLIVFTFPLWMPVYFFYTSLHKSIAIIKTLIKLPYLVLNHNPHPQHPAYGILRGNGKYLKSNDPNVYLHQLYDFSFRKFLTVSSFDTQMKVVEVECESPIGLEYLAQKCKIRDVIGVTSNSNKFRALKNSYSTGTFQLTDYKSDNTNAKSIDCFISLNLKEKLPPQIDILRVIGYMRYQLSTQGYIIFGDWVEDGEVNVLLQLFRAYGLQSTQTQNITKNVEIAEKMIRKLKEQKYYEQYLLGICSGIIDTYRERILKILGLTRHHDQLKYYVFILQKSK